MNYWLRDWFQEYYYIFLTQSHIVNFCKVFEFTEESSMTGEELQQLLQQKWGVSYDVQLRRVRGQIFLQVMWKI